MARLAADQQVRQWQWQRAAAGEDADSVAGAAGATVTQGQPDKAFVSVMCRVALRCLWRLHQPKCACAKVSTCLTGLDFVVTLFLMSPCLLTCDVWYAICFFPLFFFFCL